MHAKAPLAVQQIAHLADLGGIGRGSARAEHQTRVGIRTETGLHPEVTLVALLRLMHLRIAGMLTFLRRGRRSNGGVDPRPLRQKQPSLAQTQMDRFEDKLRETPGLQQLVKRPCNGRGDATSVSLAKQGGR